MTSNQTSSRSLDVRSQTNAFFKANLKQFIVIGLIFLVISLLFNYLQIICLLIYRNLPVTVENVLLYDSFEAVTLGASWFSAGYVAITVSFATLQGFLTTVISIAILSAIDRGELDKSDLLAVFKMDVKNLVFLIFLISLIVYILSFFLFIPALIASYSLYMSYFIMYDFEKSDAIQSMKLSYNHMRGKRFQLFKNHFFYNIWAFVVLMVNLVILVAFPQLAPITTVVVIVLSSVITVIINIVNVQFYNAYVRPELTSI